VQMCSIRRRSSRGPELAASHTVYAEMVLEVGVCFRGLGLWRRGGVAAGMGCWGNQILIVL